MNYQRIYDDLINNAVNRTIDGYTERHHILPKSLGGTNHKTNLVHLTAREHYIAHKLLVKIHSNVGGEAYKKMVYAMWFLSKTLVDQRKVTSRSYEVARLAFSQANPNKDEKRKERFRQRHKNGEYNYDYDRVSVTLKNTLSQLSADDMAARTEAMRNCDQVKRGDAIRKGKASQMRVTFTDGSTRCFWSYDDVRAITGKSYDSVKIALRKSDGLLSNGNRVEWIDRYEAINQYTKQ